MSKSIIDNLIANKLQELKFDFKAEYWDKMQEHIDAECAQTNTCSSITISGFLSGSLLVTLFSIISIIIFFPWEINNSVPTQNLDTPTIEDSNSIATTDVREDIMEYTQAKDKQESTNNTPVKKQINAKAESKKRVTKKTHLSKKHSHKASKKTIVNTATIEQKQTPETEIIVEKVNPDSLNINQDFGIVEKEDKTPIAETTLELENDSVVIPDGKILEGQNKVEEKEFKIIVQPKPVPVKNVKTRRKTNKRVFKKRGILYRLGLRK